MTYENILTFIIENFCEYIMRIVQQFLDVYPTCEIEI